MKTISKCFRLLMARMVTEMEWILKKLGQLFQVSMLCLYKSHCLKTCYSLLYV